MSNKPKCLEPRLSQEALGLLGAKINHKNDADWAPTITLLATLDPKTARKRLMTAK